MPDIIPISIDQKTSQPSYKRIALAILKNDTSLKSLGFTPKKSKVYYELKIIELIEKGKIKYIQKSLF